MSMTIRRLGPGDEAVLELLAREDAAFDLDERGKPLRPLEPAVAQLFLANPAVLHWIAEDGLQVIGHLYCVVLPLRAGDAQELILYEIGIRDGWRRRGVGRALLDQMEGWMRDNHVNLVWVLADNQIAVEFYRGCGFEAEHPQPVYMVRELEAARG